MEQSCQVFLFGPFRVRHDGAFCSFRISGATRGLFAYLLAKAGEAVRRDVLMAQFWPASDVDRARSSLNTALWRIKKAIVGYDGLTLSSFDDLVALEVDNTIQIDAAVLQRRTATARAVMNDQGALDTEMRHQLAQAVSMCSGAYFEGEDAHWALIERERMAAVLMRALGLLMEDAEAAGRIEDALMWGQEILSVDPLREAVHHAMMQMFLVAGERGRAVRQYDLLVHLLNEELGVEPDRETVSLRAQIGPVASVRHHDPLSAVTAM